MLSSVSSLMTTTMTGDAVTTGRTKRATVRLDRETIVDAAVRIAARGESDGLTGKALGVELGVDRSAVWRHFDDKDALLRAVGDKLFETAVAKVPEGLSPSDRLESLAKAVVEEFVAHPYVGTAISLHFTWGPGGLATMEMMLSALEELGLGESEVVLYQRMLADTILAFAGARAGYALLPEETRSVEETALIKHYMVVNPDEYPSIAANAARLALVEFDAIFDALLAALRAAVEQRGNARSDGQESEQ